MGRPPKPLTEEENLAFEKYVGQGKSVKFMAGKLGKSENTVEYFLNQLNGGETTKEGAEVAEVESGELVSDEVKNKAVFLLVEGGMDEVTARNNVERISKKAVKKVTKPQDIYKHITNPSRIQKDISKKEGTAILTHDLNQQIEKKMENRAAKKVRNKDIFKIRADK